MNVSRILEIMEGYAPKTLALEYDNVGLLLGESSKTVNKVLVALDLSDAVAQEAVDLQVDMIITHHPMIFAPLKRITDETSQGRRIIKLLRQGIAVYTSHTNLDIAEGGTNDALFSELELEEKENLCKTSENVALGRIGKVSKNMNLMEFTNFVKTKLNLKFIRVSGNPDRMVHKIGICTGSASDPKYLQMAVENGCDTYITGDVIHHHAQAATELGIALIDATHYATEIIIVDKICNYLSAKTNEIEIIKSKRDIGFLYEL